MKADVELDPPVGILAFADEGVGPGVRSLGAADVESRRGYMTSGEAFFLEADGPGPGRFQLYVDEPVPEEVAAVCSAPGMSFRLRLPSGRLCVSALAEGSNEADEPPEVRTLEVPPGDYAVSVLDRKAQGKTADAIADADWRLFERVNHFGAVGCLFIALGMLFVLIPHTRREYWYLLPMFLLPTCAFIFLRHLPGYARVSKQTRQHEAVLPRYVISIQRSR